MGETITISESNIAANHVLPQPTRTLATEDDDEPPCSGSKHRPTQMKTSSDEFLISVTHTAAQDVDVDVSAGAAAKNGTLVTDARDEKAEVKANSAPSKYDKANATSTTMAIAPHRRPLSGGPGTRLRILFTPTKPIGPAPSYSASLKAALKYTPLNVCLAFIPISWALHYTHQSATLVFVFSCLGIVPLAALLGFGTEQIALRTSSSFGGLLNATLGNIVEMIIAGIALQKCELELVQSSLLGGLLSNLLLVLGMAFIVGGFRFHQQEFQPMVAQLNSSLMIVCVTSLIVPMAFHEYLEDRLAPGTEVSVLLQLSRGSAVILILIYVAYLFFQFYSHNYLFLDTNQTGSLGSGSSRSSFARTSTETLPAPITATASRSSDQEIEYLKLNAPTALFLLVATTTLAYFTAEHLVSSLEGLVSSHPRISKEWITLIVIPVISNAAEHTTAVVVARKGKFDLAMSVAVGSCIQIALFVIPVLVLVAWGMDKPLTLLFDPLETVVLFFSVLLVKFSVEDGKSHWLSGVVLISVYVLIALSFWNFPETERMLQGRHLSC